MNDTSVQEVDLVVAGGGPSGSTLATLVAMQGHKVLLLEKERFPRYQIGESLLPSTIHGICVMLGIDEEVKNAGFPLKRGGTFRWGTSPDPWTFTFALSPAMAGPTSYAYQVERMKFDSILLDNARHKGVDVREGYSVSDVVVEGDRVVGVRFKDDEGRQQTVRSKYFGAAAGNASHLHKKLGGTREYSDLFRNVALFCYFEDGKRLDPPNEGNILCAAFKDGWFWYIPLSDKLTSVGAVIAREKAYKIQQQGHEDAMSEFIASCPIIADYLSSARRVTEGPYGQFRVRKDYSYCNTRFWKPGMFAVGDAACFVDPVFSSGVHLATYSALLAARSVNTCLEGGIDEERCFSEFEIRYRREFGVFYQFLSAFYDMEQDERSYFWEARKVINTDESDVEAFIRLVGGVSTSGEPLFPDTEAFKSSTESIGRSLEEAAYDTTPEGDSVSDLMLRGEVAESLWQESRQIRIQATRGGSRRQEAPLRASGLVPSVDGFHWSDPDDSGGAPADARQKADPREDRPVAAP